MSHHNRYTLSPYRFFSPDPAIRTLAVDLFQQVEHLPIVSPHGHVNPALFCSDAGDTASPVDVLVLSDDYITRRLFSLGISYEKMGYPQADADGNQADPENAWQILCEHTRELTGTTAGICFDYMLQRDFWNGRTAGGG